MSDIRYDNNLNILSKVSTLAKRTVDYYLDKDDGNILNSVKSKQYQDDLSYTVDSLIANELMEKYKLA